MNKETKTYQQKLTKPMKYIAIFLLIVIVLSIIYLNLRRYEFIGHSVSKGDVTSAAMLFTPELASSVAHILYGK